MASFRGFTDNLVDTVECPHRLLQATRNDIFAQDDGSIDTFVGSVAWGKHGAVLGHGGVDGYALQLRTLVAWSGR